MQEGAEARAQCPTLRITMAFMINMLPAVRLDPGTLRTAVKHVTTRPLRPALGHWHISTL